ncbi:MAG: hypothetical protein ACTS3F_04765 [Phycisphaerales bacterium]
MTPDHRRTRNHRTRAAGVGIGIAALFAALAPLAGCASGRRALVDEPEHAYPEGASLSERALDVHVLRDGTRISFTNTTPGVLGPGTLWANKEFRAPLPPVAPGQTRTMNLYSFTNRFGQTFRAGGFFATEPPALLVSVELQPEDDESKLFPLLVVRGEE